MSELLPDVLLPDLKLVFCGTAASARSAQIGAYYAGPGNRFWPTLYETGLTPTLFEPSQFRRVTEYGIGLTDVAKCASGTDSALSPTDFDAQALVKKISVYEPGIIAFTSKRAAREGLSVTAGQSIEYGWQQQTIGITRVFVLPSPSGAARGYWDVTFWSLLAEEVRQLGS